MLLIVLQDNIPFSLQNIKCFCIIFMEADVKLSFLLENYGVLKKLYEYNKLGDFELSLALAKLKNVTEPIMVAYNDTVTALTFEYGDKDTGKIVGLEKVRAYNEKLKDATVKEIEEIEFPALDQKAVKKLLDDEAFTIEDISSLIALGMYDA